MKQKTVILLIILLALLALAACGTEAVTYADAGTIIITITNSGIDADEVDVYVNDEDAEYDYDDDQIIITKDNMLRTMVTLEAEGYQTENLLVTSADFDPITCIAEKTVTLEEAYTLLTIEVKTQATSNLIEVEGENIEEMTQDGKTFLLKLAYEALPEIFVSAGTEYDDYSFTLDENDVKTGICTKIVVLKDKDNALVEFNLDSSIQIDYVSSLDRNYIAYQSGRTTFYEINKDDEVRFYLRDTSNNYSYVGEINLSSSDMLTEDTFYYTYEDTSCGISYSLAPYLTENSTWHVLAEKTGVGEYEPVEYMSYSYSNYYVFERSKTYTIFCMCGDGEIRYKDLDFSEVNSNGYQLTLSISFTASDPIRTVSVKIVDFLNETTNFTGVTLTSDYAESLGTISGNQCNINASNFYRSIYASGFSGGYTYVQSDYIYSREDILSNLVINGEYVIYAFKPFALRVTILNPASYEGEYISDYSVYPSVNYNFNSSNIAYLTDYSFNGNYTLSINYRDFNSSYVQGIGNIKKDIGGNYYINITIS